MEGQQPMSKLEEAKSYISYGIKEGYFDESQFEGMSDEELIKFADEASARGDAYADSLMENQREQEEERKEAYKEAGGE
jgi:hypothetical protein